MTLFPSNFKETHFSSPREKRPPPLIGSTAPFARGSRRGRRPTEESREKGVFFGRAPAGIAGLNLQREGGTTRVA